MKNTFGNTISLTLFGESHGPAIGAVLDGLPPGLVIDEKYIGNKLRQRRAQGKISTARQEEDRVEFVSGVFEGRTTGTPLCLLIRNEKAHSADYGDGRKSRPARPSHADYTGFCKYEGYEDYRGGGHFSGRITAPLVAAGAILARALEGRGIYIGTHIRGLCEGIYLSGQRRVSGAGRGSRRTDPRRNPQGSGRRRQHRRHFGNGGDRASGRGRGALV